jgi:benzodiazapine receptor
MSEAKPAQPSSSPVALLVALAVSFGAQALAASISHANMDWYETLQKPVFTPPAIAFPIVWTTLYALMAVSVWVFWRRVETASLRKRGLTWFGIQLVLNVAWTFAFFGLHRPLYGVAVIFMLLLAIVVTIVLFHRASRTASLLLMPYCLWVAFAAALNIGVFVLNPGG